MAESVALVSGREVRKDIQALRALAVAAVLIFHMRPEWLSGGFVGVDIFFVLSGFLISTHLLDELAATGRINLGKFWSRRIQRLLPASLTVLAFAVIVTVSVIPEGLRIRYMRDIIGATFYAANWIFASDSVDYLASQESPSIVLHYWSLGVEEQLYLAWPILLFAAWLLVSKLKRFPKLQFSGGGGRIYRHLNRFDSQPLVGSMDGFTRRFGSLLRNHG